MIADFRIIGMTAVDQPPDWQGKTIVADYSVQTGATILNGLRLCRMSDGAIGTFIPRYSVPGHGRVPAYRFSDSAMKSKVTAAAIAMAEQMGIGLHAKAAE